LGLRWRGPLGIEDLQLISLGREILREESDGRK
jgi:hypothetical protein